MRSDNCSAERTKWQTRNFEKLLSEGNADNRDAQQNPDQKVAQSQHPSADQEPGNIKQEGNTDQASKNDPQDISKNSHL